MHEKFQEIKVPLFLQFYESFNMKYSVENGAANMDVSTDNVLRLYI